MARINIMQLREERNRLLSLARKKRKIRIAKERLLKEERKLKKEIAELKSQTIRRISRRIVMVAKSPELKRKLKKAKSIFLKFADNLSKADI